MFLNFVERGINLNNVTRYEFVPERVAHDDNNEPFITTPRVVVWFIGDAEPLVISGVEALCFIGYVTRSPVGVFVRDEVPQ